MSRPGYSLQITEVFKMINPYHDRIDIAKVLDLQQKQYQNSLYLEQSVEANSQIDAAINVTSLGHFMLMAITGSYTTLTTDNADDGQNHLYIQLLDGGNQLPLFDDFISANLILSPGRETTAAADPDDQPLRLEWPFVYTFQMNDQIIVRIKNDAPVANTLKMQFKGIRVYPSNRKYT